MGNQTIKNIDVNNYNPSQWKVIGYDRQNAQILQSKANKEKSQLKIIFLDPKLNLQNQIQIYQYRKDQNNALVRCLAVSIEENKKKSLCGTGTMITVLTERIPLRYNQLPQLTFQEALYALSEALRGFKECYQRVGSFEITDQMIGVNTEGQIKVWVNSNFAENHPLTEKPFLHTSGTVNKKQFGVQDFIVKQDEVSLVKKVTKIIEQKCLSSKFPQSFSLQIRKDLDFNQTFDLIEKYAEKNGIFIPNKILNTQQSYQKKPSHFTPGIQYKRDEKDPMYRRKVQFPPELRCQNNSGIENDKNTIQYQQGIAPNLRPVKRVQSPIIQLYQSDNSLQYLQDIKIGGPYKSKNMREISQISPQTSTLVFNNQSCIRPHLQIKRN